MGASRQDRNGEKRGKGREGGKGEGRGNSAMVVGIDAPGD